MTAKTGEEMVKKPRTVRFRDLPDACYLAPGEAIKSSI
jgi:hypothetical protein